MRIAARHVRAAYAMFRELPPFNRWKLPETDSVRFRVNNSRRELGSYDNPNGKHTITLSRKLIGSFHGLALVTAHEIIHLAQRINGKENKAQHNRQWVRMAHLTCKTMGWETKGFR